MRGLALWFASLAALLAQTAPPDQVLQLSLKRAVEIALAPEGNVRAQLALESVKQSETRSLQARAALLPNLEASVTDENEVRNLAAFGIQFPAIPGVHFATIVGPFDVFDARASVTQSVFDFSSIRRYQASKVSVDAAKADNEGTRNQVTDQVAQAYLAGLRAKAAWETAKANADLSEALLRLARSQKDVGTGTGIEVTRAQVQLANDKQRLLVAETDRHRTYLQLLKVMGLRLEMTVELTDSLSYAPVDVTTTDKALAIARDNRAELKAQLKREESARLNYSSVKMERLPSVAAFADYGTIGSGIDHASPTRTYGVQVRVPVFDGGRRDARRVESFSQYHQEELRTKDLKDQIELDVRTAMDSLRSAENQIAAAKEGLALAENELAQARRRYQAGVANSIEVTDAQTRLARARDNQISALYNYNVAHIDLATAMGTIQQMAGF